MPRSLPVRATLATLVAGGTLAVAGCSAEVVDSTADGSPSLAVSGDLLHVLTPAGRVEVVVGEPVDQLASADTASGEARSSADGEHLVPVEWWLETSRAPVVGAPYLTPSPLGDPPRVDVAVVAGDRDVALGSTPERGSTTRRWVSIPDGESPVVEVTYDGVTQRLDVATGEVEPSVASPYGDPDLGATDRPRCRAGRSSETRPGFDVVHSCDAEVVSGLPWADVVGWAEPGTTWTIFSLGHFSNLQFDRGEAYAFYDGDLGSVGAVRCGDVEATRIDDVDRYDPWMACAIPDGQDVEVSGVVTYEFTRDSDLGDTPAPPQSTDEFTATFSVRGRTA